MDEYDAIPHQGDDGTGRSSVFLFLALYLLVLAFFIMLVNISTLEEVKSKEVMNSLTSTFASLLPPTSELTDFVSRDGDVLAGQEFHANIQGVFVTAIKVVRTGVIQPGREMRVVVESDALFFPGESRIREAQFPLLDRIVAALSGAPPGLRFEMDFVIGSPYAVGKSLPIGQTLETSRASAFVRHMLSRGVPPDSVGIGLKPGSPGEITLWFIVRSSDEARQRWAAPEAAGNP